MAKGERFLAMPGRTIVRRSCAQVRGASSEFETQAELTLSSRQPFGDGAEGVGDQTLLVLYGGGVAGVEEVEEFKEALDAQSLANNPGFGYAHIHIDESRRTKGVSTGLEIAPSKAPVSILIDRSKCCSSVLEAALRAEQAAELYLPRQIH